MVGSSFTHSCSDWRDGTYEHFKEWAVKQFGLKDLDSDDEGEVPVHMQKAKDIAFERNREGEYILPDMSNYRTIRQRQRVVRGYIGAVYSMSFQPPGLCFLIQMTGEFTGNSRAAFPYSLASKEDQTIFSPECVPEGFTLSDPDHLSGVKIVALYSHWWRRQQKGLSPLIILNASPNHGANGKKKSANSKEKKKLEYVEIDDDEPDKEGDGEGSQEKSLDGNDDEEIPPAVKFGPPGRKAKKIIPIPTQDPPQATEPPIAGPSTLPPPKDSPKKRIGKRKQPAKVKATIAGNMKNGGRPATRASSKMNPTREKEPVNTVSDSSKPGNHWTLTLC